MRLFLQSRRRGLLLLCASLFSTAALASSPGSVSALTTPSAPAPTGVSVSTTPPTPQNLFVSPTRLVISGPAWTNGSGTLFIQNTSATATITVTNITATSSSITFSQTSGIIPPTGSMIVTVTGRITTISSSYNYTVSSTAGSATGTLTFQPVAAPSISVTPSPLALGSVPVGTTATGNLTVTNSGTAPLTITGVTSSNPRFSVSPTTTTIAAGASTPLSVAFTPTTVGAQVSTVRISSNDTNQPTLSVIVNGSGMSVAGAGIAVSPTSLDVGTALVGSTVATGMVTVTNTGTSTLNLSNVATTNPAFTVSPTTATLVAGGSTDLAVTFTPTTAGVQSGNLVIASNATSQPILTVPLSGTGTTIPVPTTQFVEQNTSFSGTAYGVDQIRVADAASVWVTAFDGSGNNNVLRDFSHTTNGGATWTDGIVPATPGLRWADLSAVNGTTAWGAFVDANNGGGELYKTTNGGLSWFRQLSTGFQSTGSYLDAVRMFSATNGVAIGDPVGTDFEVYTTANGGTTWTRVPAANLPNALTGEFVYLGQMVTNGTANVWFGTTLGRVFRSTNGGQSWSVSTTPLTTIQHIAFSSATDGLILETDNTTAALVGMARTTNGGVTWTSVTPSGTVYTRDLQNVPGRAGTYVSAGPYISTLGAGSSYSLDGGLTWNALETGVQRTSIGAADVSHVWAGNYTRTDVSTSQIVGGIFFGALPISPAISVSPTSLTLGSVAVGSTTSGTLTVTNNGSTPLVISGVTSSNGVFTVTPRTATVAAGATTTLTVTFTPTAIGSQTGTLTIASNAGGQPTVTVTVTGTGMAPPTASVDGVLDAGNAYGNPVVVQTNTTGFGDASASSGGSELDAAYARIANGKLYLLLTGNLEPNGNDLELFFDTRAGGQNTLSATNPFVDNDALAQLAGLSFDPAFSPDYYLTVQQTTGTTAPLLTAHYAALTGTGGIGQVLTDGSEDSAKTLNFGAIGTGSLGINNTNAAGVSDLVIGNPAGVTTGVELEIPLAAIGNPTGAFKISAFINGAQHDFVSNQVLGGLPLGTANLGQPSTVSFASATNAGNQYFLVSPPAPVATVSTTTLNVGNVTVGSTGAATFTITNTGTLALSISGITSSNPSFTISPATGTVAAGGSLTVTVTFAPTVVGPQAGALTILSNDPAQPALTVALSGNGTAAPAPVIAVSPTTLSLGSVVVGSTSTQTFTVSNTGNAPLTIAAITSTNAQFTVSPAMGTIAAGGSLTITVTFAPTAASAQTATLTITSNAGQATVALTGTGTAAPAPVLAVSPASLSLGSTTVGTTSTQTFTISNPGNAPLTVTGITSSNAQFTVSPATGTIAAGGSLTVTVTFAPTVAIAQTGTLLITTNATPATATVALTGTGTAVPAPVAAVSLTSLNVGTVSVGTSLTAPFTISNSGNAPLTVTGITSSNGQFTVSPATGTVAAGGSLTVTVTFAPAAVGAQSGTLTIASNDPTQPTLTVAVSGTGTAAPAGILTVSVTSLTLNTVAVGSTSTGTLTITNTGNAPLTNLTLTTSGGTFTVTPASAGPLAPGASVTVTVSFTPTTTGPQTSVLTILADGLTPTTVTLTGDTVTGLAADALTAMLHVYPNPTADGQAVVEWLGSGTPPTSVIVLDQLGRKVQQVVLTNGQARLQHLAHGLYVLRVQTPAGWATRRLVVE
jgi:Abnormal spindle-like microcephaly-assoc'd, ASPM-SPD-2-Hydin/CARDB